MSQDTAGNPWAEEKKQQGVRNRQGERRLCVWGFWGLYEVRSTKNRSRHHDGLADNDMATAGQPTARHSDGEAEPQIEASPRPLHGRPLGVGTRLEPGIEREINRELQYCRLRTVVKESQGIIGKGTYF